jgi:hypothetical protein
MPRRCVLRSTFPTKREAEIPVSKYRSVAEMPAPARASGSDLVARIRSLWRRSFLLSPPDFARGVQRFRSIEAANQARARATAERLRARAGRPR